MYGACVLNICIGHLSRDWVPYICSRHLHRASVLVKSMGLLGIIRCPFGQLDVFIGLQESGYLLNPIQILDEFLMNSGFSLSQIQEISSFLFYSHGDRTGWSSAIEIQPLESIRWIAAVELQPLHRELDRRVSVKT